MSCMGLYEFMRRLLGESVNKLFIYIQPLQFYQYRVANTNNIPTLFGKFLFYFRLLPLLQQQFKLVSNIFYNEQKTAFSNISIFYWRYDNLLHLLTAQRWTYILSDKRARWRRRRARMKHKERKQFPIIIINKFRSQNRRCKYVAI